jgi:SAM-dependent methyltransferase
MVQPGFDQPYWEQHWSQAAHRSGDSAEPNPYVAAETSTLTPATALDAGCGDGAEAAWLAARGWQVTAADISSEALARARRREAGQHVNWVRADLTVWAPATAFDLVMTHYAHPAMPQLAFYDRISAWVAPGGSLLIVGHLHASDSAGAGHHPAEATVSVADVTAGLDTAEWEIVTAEEHVRAAPAHGGRSAPLADLVVRATRRR